MPCIFLHISFTELIRSLAWCFFHSLWIGMIAALAIVLLQYLFGKVSARKRYFIFTGIFVSSLLLVFLKFLIELNKANFPAASTIVSQQTSVLILDHNKQELATFPLNSFINIYNWAAIGLIGLWALFFIIQIASVIKGKAKQLVAASTPIEESELVVWLEREKSQLDIRTKISLYSSASISTAMVAGCLRPKILLPERLMHDLDPVQLQTIVLHELIHIKNKDHWFNAIQVFFEKVFFFNPGFLWISETIREEREARCDSCVIARTNNKQLYLKTLVSAYEFSFYASNQFIYFFRKKHEVLERVNRIMDIHPKRLDFKNSIFFMAGFTALFLINPDFKSAPYHSDSFFPMQEKSKQVDIRDEELSIQQMLSQAELVSSQATIVEV